MSNPVGRHAAEATQELYPWRTVIRSVFEAAVSFAAMWGIIVVALGVDETLPWVAASLVVTGAVTKVMALPAVNDWLTRFVPWLAAQPPVPSQIGE